jgi:WhiB family transcriptional regulator, redox-sensing transcriptional regulator
MLLFTTAHLPDIIGLMGRSTEANPGRNRTMWDKNNWRKGGACREVDTAVFFPDPSDEVATAAAKAVCRTCPVREFCLDFALITRQDDGVWGGLDEKERRRIRRRRTPQESDQKAG